MALAVSLLWQVYICAKLPQSLINYRMLLTFYNLALVNLFNFINTAIWSYFLWTNFSSFASSSEIWVLQHRFRDICLYQDYFLFRWFSVLYVMTSILRADTPLLTHAALMSSVNGSFFQLEETGWESCSLKLILLWIYNANHISHYQGTSSWV